MPLRAGTDSDWQQGTRGHHKSLASRTPGFGGGTSVWTLNSYTASQPTAPLSTPFRCPVPPLPASWPHTHLFPSCSVRQVRFPVEGSQDGPFTLRARSSHFLEQQYPCSRQQEMHGGRSRTGRGGTPWAPEGDLNPLFQVSSSLHEIVPHRNNAQKPCPSPIAHKGGLTPPLLSPGPRLSNMLIPSRIPLPLVSGDQGQG